VLRSARRRATLCLFGISAAIALAADVVGRFVLNVHNDSRVEGHRFGPGTWPWLVAEVALPVSAAMLALATNTAVGRRATNTNTWRLGEKLVGSLALSVSLLGAAFMFGTGALPEFYTSPRPNPPFVNTAYLASLLYLAAAALQCAGLVAGRLVTIACDRGPGIQPAGSGS